LNVAVIRAKALEDPRATGQGVNHDPMPATESHRGRDFEILEIDGADLDR
jgi:hypothetical protein